MLAGHERAALQFSGGKDSTALLHLARPHLDRITVYWGDTGAAFPHVRAYVHETCERLRARLVTVPSPVPVAEYIDAVGLPADIVPVEASPAMRPYMTNPPRQFLQPYIQCCATMLWLPMQQAIARHGHTLVLRGSKRADARVGVGPDHVEDGITYRSPLWDWSDGDVMGYLAAEGVALPEHYGAVPDSLDCWLCTAYLAHHGAAKMRWMRERYPDLWPAVAERMGRVEGAIEAERQRVAAAFDEAKG